jgi:hypothetical protein
MSIKSGLLAVAAMSALLAGALVGIPSASAGDQRASAAVKRHCIGNDAGAFVCFQPRGDKFLVKDTSQNGLSAAVVWETDYGRKSTCRNKWGKDAWVTCNYNFREDRYVKFWAVDIDGPTNAHKNWSQHRRVRS